MKLFQLSTFVDQKDLDSLSEALEQMAQMPPVVVKTLADMLDNVEEIDDELTYSDSSRANGDTDADPE